MPAMAENPSAAQPIQTVLQVWSAFRIMCRLGGSEELTFIFYNVPSFLSGAHICLVIRTLRMNNGAV